MQKETYCLTMNDNESVSIQEWYNPDKRPKAVVQISHGMAEHIDRYHPFAVFLVQNGFHVIGNDHRGHGRTGENINAMGYFSDTEGFEKTVEDLHVITDHIKDQFTNVPIILFGHSMGSFLARRYIQMYSSDLTGVILSGTGSQPTIAINAGKLIAKLEMWRKDPKTPSPLLNKLAFGRFAKQIKNAKTSFDWLSRDNEQVKLYIDDPRTGFTPSSSFFYDLFQGINMIQDLTKVNGIAKELPMLFISGEKDPVGDRTIGVKKAVKQYEKVGIKNIHTIIYPESRHELLNEVNKAEVYRDIIDWINKQLQ